MALALALIALVLVGAFVAGLCFVGLQESHVGESAGRLQRSFGVVEAGLAEVIHAWDPGVYNARAALPFDSVPVPAGSFGGHVYKLNGELYFIDLTASDSLTSVSGVRQRVGLLARVRPVTPRPHAALTTGKAVHLSGRVTVDGTDRVPPAWGPCGPPDSGKAGIDSMTSVGPAAGLGGLTFDRLAALATHTLPSQVFRAGVGPVVMSGRCDETVAINWGDGRNPSEPCGSYFPVVHIAGDATMSRLQGQGILLVDGSLVVRGGVEWYGVVLIRGTLTVIGDPFDDIAIWGAMLIGDSVVLEGGPDRSVTINYSKCPITKALETVAGVAMLRSRGWVSLSDVP